MTPFLDETFVDVNILGLTIEAIFELVISEFLGRNFKYI